MAAAILLEDAKQDTEGRDVSIRIIGSQISPAKITIPIAIKGTAKVQIHGRLHRKAPWANTGEQYEKSCLIHIEPIAAQRVILQTLATPPSGSSDERMRSAFDSITSSGSITGD